MADDDILEANRRFYDAFARGDADAMDALWARTHPVACVHPGWTALRGRARVMASFRGILAHRPPPDIRFSEPSVHPLGEVAFVVCYEHVAGARLLATNLFAREDGEWRMVHHQAGPTTGKGPPDLPPTELN
jgi:ketosteroid isomerase-like protein